MIVLLILIFCAMMLNPARAAAKSLRLRPSLPIVGVQMEFRRKTSFLKSSIKPSQKHNAPISSCAIHARRPPPDSLKNWCANIRAFSSSRQRSARHYNFHDTAFVVARTRDCFQQSSACPSSSSATACPRRNRNSGIRLGAKSEFASATI